MENDDCITTKWRKALENKRWDIIVRIFEIFNSYNITNKNGKILQVSLTVIDGNEQFVKFQTKENFELEKPTIVVECNCE